MPLTLNGYAFLGLTALVAVLAAAFCFAVLQFGRVARKWSRSGRPGRSDAPLVPLALEEAIRRLMAQERATAARADASERLSAEIIASLTAGLLVVGLQNEVRTVNPAGRRMLGLPDTSPLDDYRSLLNEPALTALIAGCLATHTAVFRKTVALAKNRAGVSHLGVTVSPMFDHLGELHGAICLFTDLTTVNELEEQLRLKEGLAAVGELTAGIAHEFRNGLATIHGYGRLIDLDALSDTHRSCVEGIRTETESLGRVVTNFLNFARPADLTLTMVDLRPACEGAAEEIRADARAGGGDVIVRGEFGEVEGDEILLRQAFSNLARNAVEACLEAGVRPAIVIESRIDRARHLSLIAVDDNGPGIDAEVRTRIFRPFFTTKRRGTGLGLALVQKIIVFHNGGVRPATSPLGGARFEVSLPLA